MTAADGPTPVSAEPVAAVQVVPLELEHLAAAARLHRRLLPSFFADLGLPYLRSYLNSYRTSPHAVALVALLEGQVVGLLVGSVSPAEHASWALRTHGGRLALWGLLGLATRPRPLVVFVRTRVSRYVRALLRRLRPLPPRATGSAVTTAPAVLAHVAVATAAQGHGAGQALVQRFAAEARAAGRPAVELVTRAGGVAEGFYARLGYQRMGERVDGDGRAWARYRLEVT